MSRVLAVSALVLAALFSAPAVQGQTISAIVGASGGEGQFDNDRSDYDILLNALILADLVETLDDPNLEVTVFAPNDRAFLRLARDFGYQGNDEQEALGAIAGVLDGLSGGDPIGLLTDILLYHVSPGDVRPFDLILATFFQSPLDTLLTGATVQPFFLFLIDNEPDLKNPRVAFPLDIAADNGRIHTINRVLIPADV